MVNGTYKRGAYAIYQLFGLNRDDRKPDYHELERLSAYLAQNLDRAENIPNLNVLSVGTCFLLRPLRKAAAKIADLHFEYEIAFWIGRTAAGLQLVRKRKASHQERVFALLVAADSIRHLIDKLGLRLPQASTTRLSWVKRELYE